MDEYICIYGIYNIHIWMNHHFQSWGPLSILISLSTITLRATAANCDDAFSVADFLGDAGQRSGPGFNFHQV